nr:small G protein signaling modulator 2-like [Salvelinus alpinus]
MRGRLLMHDSVFGPILAYLLVGPCALEYTKLKTSDHFWTDPSANELVQRHGAHRGQDASPSRRPALGIQKRQSSVSMSEDKFAASARNTWNSSSELPYSPALRQKQRPASNRRKKWRCYGGTCPFTRQGITSP